MNTAQPTAHPATLQPAPERPAGNGPKHDGRSGGPERQHVRNPTRPEIGHTRSGAYRDDRRIGERERWHLRTRRIRRNPQVLHVAVVFAVSQPEQGDDVVPDHHADHTDKDPEEGVLHQILRVLVPKKREICGPPSRPDAGITHAQGPAAHIVPASPPGVNRLADRAREARRDAVVGGVDRRCPGSAGR